MILKKYFEFKKSDLKPVKSFRIKNDLNDDVWDDDKKLRPEVREQLLSIAQDFYNSVELEADVYDIILTGSLANYNYSKKYADFDLHIIIDFNDIDENLKLVEMYVDSSKTLWNKNHDIKIKGYDVEVYIQDKNAEHTSTGIYSVLKNKWNIVPVKQDFKPNEMEIEKKSISIMNLIDSLEEDVNTTLEDIKKVWKKIKDLRKSGLKEGEFGLGNLVFKTLRRNNYLSKIISLKRSVYDKQFK